MGRDNYNYGKGVMKNNSEQNQMVRNAAREVGISEMELSREVHDLKDDWYGGDFSYQELLQIASDIKKRKESKW